MSNKPPPVPPAGRTTKASDQTEPPRDTRHGRAAVENKDEQGRSGNIHQNTTHQGHQQDR
jgi:hypothetical protein